MDSLECESLRERLLAVRANRDLTRAEVARSAGVSHDTVKKIEEGRTLPGVDTAERLARALGLDPRWLVFGQGTYERTTRTIMVTPDYDPLRMCRELREALASPNGYLLDSYKYLDPAGAQDWAQLLDDKGFSAVVDALPMSSLVDHLVLALDGHPYDVWGLGSGTGQMELSLVARLVGKKQRDVRVFLVDVSQPLLTEALRKSEQTLGKSKKYPIPVIGLLGDFNQFPSFGLLPGAGRRRLLTMFGYTLSNLENETRFIRRSLSWVNRGDILILDVPKAVAQNDDDILRNDPALKKRRAGQWSDLLEPFLTGPILRHVAGISTIKVTAQLDRGSSVIPGSYAIEYVADVKLTTGQARRYSIGYSKRYTEEGVTAIMLQEGWEKLCCMEYGPALLFAFRRTNSPQLQKQGRPRRKESNSVAG